MGTTMEPSVGMMDIPGGEDLKDGGSVVGCGIVITNDSLNKGRNLIVGGLAVVRLRAAAKDVMCLIETLGPAQETFRGVKGTARNLLNGELFHFDVDDEDGVWAVHDLEWRELGERIPRHIPRELFSVAEGEEERVQNEYREFKLKKERALKLPTKKKTAVKAKPKAKTKAKAAATTTGKTKAKRAKKASASR